jgi:MoxR-like ATPase/predicted RNA-binding protein
LDPSEFSGGIETNNYLEALGFEVVKKPIMEEGQKWLAVASDENWKKCLENHVWGADDNRAQQIKKMHKNDEIIVYLVGMKLAGICKVVSDYYYDNTKIWDSDIYPHRVKIEPITILSSPIDIKKTYHVYLRYKGSPGGYFGQAIRPLPDNEFSIFQSKVALNMNELAKWNNNDFIQDFATLLKTYLENKFSINLTKKRSHIFFNSGAVIHIRGSKIHSDGTGFYYLQQKDYEDTIKNTDRFFVIVFGNVDTVFIIPSEKLKEIFKDQPVVKRDSEEPKWYFDVFENNDKKHFLRVHSNSSSNVFDIENYLNKWEQIPELITQKKNVNVFVTGYDDTNVKISKEYKILGWKNKSQPSIGDLIFIYNTTTKKIQCGFRIKSKSNIEKPIWYDEINSEPPRQIYKYRWEAELVCDNLNIGLEEINQIPPFKADSEGKKAKFGILVLGDSPNSLTKPIYKTFRDYLLNKCDNNKMRVQEEETESWSFDIQKAIEEILVPNTENELAIKVELVERILNHLKSGKNVILVGPPGVGKTDLARRILKIIGKKVIDDEDFMQSVASDEWSRFDVIGGLNLDNKFQEGWITKAIREKKWLLIDEFNRANMNKAFGEMFLGLEYNKIDLKPSEAKVYENRSIEIPKNFRMICTMNDFDKNLLLSELSYGLISRFAFVSITPDTDKEAEVVKKRVKKFLNDNINYEKYEEQINTYFNFINDVRQQRNIGVRTSIDVIKYLIISTKDNPTKNNTADDYKWLALNDALCDYVLPQFDRLDGKTIKYVLTSANKHLKDSNNENIKMDKFDNFIRELQNTLDNLQKASEWLSYKNDL